MEHFFNFPFNFGLLSIVLENRTNALNITKHESLFIFVGYLSKNGPSR